MKVWFQNRRTKHKREETEADQTVALKNGGSGGGGPSSAYAAQTSLIDDEDDEDIDCE